MSALQTTPGFRAGLVVHGNKIWISEFMSIFFVSSILLAFFSLTSFILVDEAVIASNDRRISSLKSDRLTRTKDLVDLPSKVRILEAMRGIIGQALPAQIYGQLADLVRKNSATFGYDPLLLLAVIQVESRFSAEALGHYKDGEASGAFGLMQIKLETAQEIAASLGMKVKSTKDLFRPEVNVPLGVAYLTQLISQFHSFKLGLLAYNQGRGVILEQLASRQPLSIDYYHRVLRNYYKFRAVTDSVGVVRDSGNNNK
jgi:soluble lytic murein transglycosylase-like protein